MCVYVCIELYKNILYIIRDCCSRNNCNAIRQSVQHPEVRDGSAKENDGSAAQIKMLVCRHRRTAVKISFFPVMRRKGI